MEIIDKNELIIYKIYGLTNLKLSGLYVNHILYWNFNNNIFLQFIF